MPSTVKKTFEAAQASGNALLAQVKGNQEQLLARLQHLARSQPPRDRNETVVRNQHGRQEHRSVETFDLTGQLDRAWDGLIVQAARVHRLGEAAGHGPLDRTQRDLVLRLPDRAVRRRFRRGGSRALDYREPQPSRPRRESGRGSQPDPCPTGAIQPYVPSFALNILRANGVRNVAQARYATALNPDKLRDFAGS